MRRIGLVAIASVTFCAVTAVSASAATPAELGSKCRAAYKGTIPSAAFTAFRTRCVAAAGRAVDRATDAGNVASPPANRARATAACAVQYPLPRRTTRKLNYGWCVSAAVSSQVAFAGRPLAATLTGANEVPATTATQTVTASVRLNQGQRRVCYTLTPSGPFSSPVSAAHIHEGAANANGGVVLPLSVVSGLTAGSRANGCENGVDANLIKRIRQRPGDFYVNVHTDEFPGGAVRGQLSK